MKFKNKENKEKKIFLRQINKFLYKNIILSGNVQPSIIDGFNFKKINIFTTKYHFFEKLNFIGKTHFGLVSNEKIFLKSNFLYISGLEIKKKHYSNYISFLII